MKREAILHRRYVRMARWGRRLSRNIRPAGWVALALGAVLFLGSVDPTRSLAYQVLALLVVMLGCDVLSLIQARPRPEARRAAPGTCVPGTAVTIGITLRNRGRRAWRKLRLVEEAPLAVPTLAEFTDTPEPGEHRRNLFDRTFIYYRFSWLGERHLTFRTAESAAFDLAPGCETTVAVRLLPLRRGHLVLGHLVLAKDGIFGFFRRTWKLDVATLRVPVVPAPGVARAEEAAGLNADRVHPDGIPPRHRSGQSDEFLTLRDYRPGDPLQHIHWASFARAGHPIVREFEDVCRPRVALILDTLLPREGGAFAWTRAFEHCLALAASCAARMESGDTLLELLLVQDRAHSFTSGPGHLHLRRIFEILAGVQPATLGSLSPLERLAFAHARQCQAALFLAVRWDDERQRFLSRLKARGLEVQALVVLPSAGASCPQAPSWVRFVLPRPAARGQWAGWSPPRPLVAAAEI